MIAPQVGRASRRYFPFRLLLFGIIAVISVAVGFLLFDAEDAKGYVNRFGYYTISFTFGWAVVAIWRIRGALAFEFQGVTRRQVSQLCAIVGGCLVVAIATTPTRYKVLYDEMVLQATAWQIHSFREINTVLRAYMIDGVFAPLDSYLDKRPFFFAYLISLLHDLTGYREANAFFFNKTLLVVVLGQCYILARRMSGHAAALAAVFAFGSMSLLALNATGAGMEMLNLVMLLLCVHVAALYLAGPDEARLTALVLVSVLLAQTRYESSLYIGPTALLVLEGWRRARRIILPAAAIVGPALLIPYALHNTYLSGTPILWELHDNQETRFAAEHLLPNIGHAVRYFFNTSSTMTNSWWLTGVGLLSLGYLAAVAWRRRRADPGVSPFGIALMSYSLGIGGNLLLLMFYYWGQLDDPIVGRLSLPFYVLLTLCTAIAIHRWSTVKWRWPLWVAGGAALTCFTTGFTANKLNGELNTLGTELEWEKRVINARPPCERLIITNKSALPWFLQRTPAVAMLGARHRMSQMRYHFERGTFGEMLVLQTYRPVHSGGGFEVLSNDRLPEAYVLEPIVERRIGARLCRISRVMDIRPDRLPPIRPRPWRMLDEKRLEELYLSLIE